MYNLNVVPYLVNQDIKIDSAILKIENSTFKGVSFVDGTSTISFCNCYFGKLSIENNQDVNFQNISVSFFNCYIGEIEVKSIVTKNLSLYFGGSLISGKIDSSNVENLQFNNCILQSGMFILNQKSVLISYTEDNIEPIGWRKILEEVKITLSELLVIKQNYYIYDFKKLTFYYSTKQHSTPGIRRNNFSNPKHNYLRYYLSQKEKDSININLNLFYSKEAEHVRTHIHDCFLKSLSLKGSAKGEIELESLNVNTLYFEELFVENGITCYDISSFNRSCEKTVLHFNKSNLDKAIFENIKFNTFQVVAFFRTRFGKSLFRACDFPEDALEYSAFKSLPNTHYENEKPDNFYKQQFETFLQLKLLLEGSGNFYEAQKLQAISNEALRKVKDVAVQDKFILSINRYSNKHGLDIKTPFVGLLLFTIPFYIFYLWSIGRMFNSNSINFDLIGYYFSFVDVTHRSDFIEKNKLSGIALFIDVINKIVVSFFVFQFITAFRKYVKSK